VVLPAQADQRLVTAQQAARRDAARRGSDGTAAKRAILQWIVQAKKPETRAKRVRETAEKAAKGERANQWTRSADKG